MTITDPAYTDTFAADATGGLLAQVLSPWKGGGKFLLVVLAFSVVYVSVPLIPASKPHRTRLLLTLLSDPHLSWMQRQQHPKHLLRRPLHPIPRPPLRPNPSLPLDNPHLRRLHRRRRSRP